MRRKLVLGVGLAGVLSGSAAAQFGSPAGAPPAPFGGGTPVGSPSLPATLPTTPAPMTPAIPATPPAGGYVAPVGGFQPAGGPVPMGGGFRPASASVPATPPPTLTPPPPEQLDIPLALGPNHPLAVKPEDGAYFICVKSYCRPSRPDPADPGLTARELAEGLAHEIQQTHRVRVLLSEYVSEEKKAEAQAKAMAKKRAEAFAAALDQYRQKSALNGMEFLEPDNRLKYQTFRHRDQVAVLVGGFRTEDEAVKALGVIKKWKPPKDTRLMDGGALTKPGPDGRPVIERTFLNPFPQAMVVQNPTVEKAAAQQTGIDPFLVKLNEGRPYSLLKATRGTWTLGVKSIAAPVIITSKDADPAAMRKPGLSRGADVLAAGAEQAEMLAKALRAMKKGPRGEPLDLEAFVLHTRSGSVVTVGQFDSPNDPALLETRRLLSTMTFNTSRDETGMQLTGTQKLFGDNLMPVPIPRP